MVEGMRPTHVAKTPVSLCAMKSSTIRYLAVFSKTDGSLAASQRIFAAGQQGSISVWPDSFSNQSMPKCFSMSAASVFARLSSQLMAFRSGTPSASTQISVSACPVMPTERTSVGCNFADANALATASRTAST